VLAARARLLETGREAIGDRDLEPGLRLMRELLRLTSFAELVERRRELLERA
jgi:hypothetical protein